MSHNEFPRPWMPAFLDAIAAGQCVSAACAAAGVSRVTAYNWRRSSPAFASAWDAAIKADADRLMREAIEAVQKWHADRERRRAKLDIRERGRRLEAKRLRRAAGKDHPPRRRRV